MTEEVPSMHLPCEIPLYLLGSSRSSVSSADHGSEQGIQDSLAEPTGASTNHHRCNSDSESVYSLSLQDAELDLGSMEAPYQWGQQQLHQEEDSLAPYQEDLKYGSDTEELMAPSSNMAMASRTEATFDKSTSGGFFTPKKLCDMFRAVGAPHSVPAEEEASSRPARQILPTKKGVAHCPIKAEARNLHRHIHPNKEDSTPLQDHQNDDASMKSERVVDSMHTGVSSSLSKETVSLEEWSDTVQVRVPTTVRSTARYAGKCCLVTTVVVLSLVVIGSVTLMFAPTPPLPGLEHLGEATAVPAPTRPAPTHPAPTRPAIPTISPVSLPEISMPAVMPAILPSVLIAPAPITILPPTELLEAVSVDADEFETPESPYHHALQFLEGESFVSDDLVQRFGVTLLDAAVGGTFRAASHECAWYGVTCNANRTVTTIRWADFLLPGRLPQDVGLLRELQVLDLGQNRLVGSIPNSLYGMVDLKDLFLHSNRLTGTLSEGIGALRNLRRLLLGENQLLGTIPQYLGSLGVGNANVRPLETISLYNNKFTGTLPTNWNLRELFYLDLGYNRLTGSLPLDWFEGRNSFSRLRILYLNDNQFSGNVPSTMGHIGNGRLTLLSIQNNTFTGEFPGFPLHNNLLNVLEMQDNNFSSMNKNAICDQIVFNYGEMVMMRADCDICKCKHFCRDGECYNPDEKKR